jgi:hypothetical protein
MAHGVGGLAQGYERRGYGDGEHTRQWAKHGAPRVGGGDVDAPRREDAAELGEPVVTREVEDEDYATQVCTPASYHWLRQAILRDNPWVT